ncbi:MAG: hypothetical protein IKP17_00640 [Oscillospiraceae bacterium]|nr:hypothetical protein [Oscillospiraceae bacterium]
MGESVRLRFPAGVLVPKGRIAPSLPGPALTAASSGRSLDSAAILRWLVLFPDEVDLGHVRVGHPGQVLEKLPLALVHAAVLRQVLGAEAFDELRRIGDFPVPGLRFFLLRLPSRSDVLHKFQRHALPPFPQNPEAQKKPP